MKATTFLTLLLCTITICAAIDIPNGYQVFDYVIIGGGGAGSVMARRLSDDSSKSVFVLNYGQDTPCPICDNTTGMTNIFQGLYTADGHDYFSVPNLFRSHSVREVRTGLPGGGTRYYGGVAIPSSEQVFDTQWPAGYKYDDVKPFLNTWQDHFCHYLDYNLTGINPQDCVNYHGQKGGPMALSPPSQGSDYPSARDFLNAAPEFDFAAVPDPFNPAYQQGDYVFPRTRFHGRVDPYDVNSTRFRASTWTGYLPANLRKDRRNLKFAWNAEATELIYRSDVALRLDVLLQIGLLNVDTRQPQAVGVAYLQDGVIKVAFAKKQIILSAGVEGSPKFLQYNGIGPADLLTSKGIKVVANNAEVGQNLAAHQAVAIAFKAKMPVPKSANSNSDILNLIMTSPYNEGFPDMEVELSLGNYIRSIDPILFGLEEPYFTTPSTPERDFPFISTIVTVTNPAFRGSVNITGPKFSSPSQVEYGWPKDVAGYAASLDYQKMKWGFERVRGILTGNNSFANKWVESEITPGKSTTQTQEYQDLLFSANYQHSIYHLTGSVSLGKATDLNGRVKGISGVTVCDNSLIPHPPNGNPTTTMITLCEIIAKKVKGY